MNHTLLTSKELLWIETARVTKTTSTLARYFTHAKGKGAIVYLKEGTYRVVFNFGNSKYNATIAATNHLEAIQLYKKHYCDTTVLRRAQFTYPKVLKPRATINPFKDYIA
jgi:hypothetical protein